MSTAAPVGSPGVVHVVPRSSRLEVRGQAVTKPSDIESNVSALIARLKFPKQEVTQSELDELSSAIEKAITEYVSGNKNKLDLGRVNLSLLAQAKIEREPVNLEHLLLLLIGQAGGIKQYPLRGAALYEAVLSGLDLSGVNLSGANLNEAFLNQTKLIRANLNNACTYRTRFGGADLTKASLSGAYLKEAWFNRAILIGADLSGANLTNAEFIEAKLHGAKLVKADLSSTDMSNADLRGADLTGADSNGRTGDDLKQWLTVKYGVIIDDTTKF